MSDINTLLAERQKTHGDFVTHAALCQELTDAMRVQSGWLHLSPDQRESLEMIQHKVARVLNGNPNEADHWRDIAGYATLVSRRLEKEQEGVK